MTATATSVERKAMSVRTAALTYDCSKQYLLDEIHAGRLPAKSKGGRFLIATTDLAAWFAALPHAI